MESSQVAATQTHLRPIMPEEDGISSARLVRRDWLLVPTPSTLPPAIQVMVMPTFCVAPKALGTGRSYGHQKVSPREMPALVSLLSHFRPPQGGSVKSYSADRAQNAIHKQKRN